LPLGDGFVVERTPCFLEEVVIVTGEVGGSEVELYLDFNLEGGERVLAESPFVSWVDEAVTRDPEQVQKGE
jgi:hypothetical protein